MNTLVELLALRAREQGGDRAFVMMAGRGVETASLTFGALHREAGRTAGQLLERGKSGDRALLLYESGLDFPLAYFGCLYAGIIPVPAPPPRKGKLRDSTIKIVADCTPRFAFAAADRIADLRAELGAGVHCAAITELQTGPEGFAPLPGRPDVAHLQYTSGSTSTPRGIRITHQNVLRNAEMIARVHGNDRTSTHVSWLPLFHDMGLVLNLLEAVYCGAPCILFEPLQFIHKPMSFLWAIHDHRGQVAGGPNFLYDHCVARYKPSEAAGLDLSSWKVAHNGAEPVRAATLARFFETFEPHGFARTAMNPCYGMAEATLLASGYRRGEAVVFEPLSKAALQDGNIAPPRDESDRFIAVGCGREVEPGSIAIADPETGLPRGERELGEIWIKGPHVAEGYWTGEASGGKFGARLPPDGAGPYMRSGDLGFLHDGQVFVAGRKKDLIIIRGANFYPQDIEGIVERCHPALRPNFSAAFGVEHDGEERLVVVQEVGRDDEPGLDIHAIAEAIRKAVSAEHGTLVTAIALIRQGTIPKTSSGKIQRSLARQQYLSRTLDEVASTATIELR